MAFTPSEHIEWTPIESPRASLPPVTVTFEVPAGAPTPSALQLQRLASIQVDFANIWRAAMSGLQARFDEMEDTRHTEDVVLGAGIYIPEPEENETEENFYWHIGVDIQDRQPWQAWQIDFNGHRFAFIVFYP